jgi:uncharacterized protein
VDRPDVPLALNQYVLKVHSRCDLACDHCYVYESADQNWRRQPTVISDEIVSQAAQRIAEHATAHQLGAVQVVLHGGEPLLAGPTRLRAIISTLHSALRDVCHLDLRIHTNGVRLNESFCDLFEEFGVKVGISLDGDRSANDRHRRYANGRSSYQAVIDAVQLLRTDRYRHLYAGLLCTIDVANDPVTVYKALLSLKPPRIDFLLPHATWDQPPARTPGQDAQYAQWLIAIFDRWLDDGRPTDIRTFESIISTLNGGTSSTEALGLTPSSLLVIETDGSYEQVDSLKTAYDGAPATGLSVRTDPVDAAAQHPGIVARQQGLDGLSETCRRCPVVTTCGGGLYTHRYRTGSGFENPSVFCADLFALIAHIEARLPLAAGKAMMPNHLVSESDFAALAAGYGGKEAMDQLAAAQHSAQRALIAKVCARAIAMAALPVSAKNAVRTASSLLEIAEQEQPKILRRILAHPYIRVWATSCVERLKAAGREGHADGNLLASLGHLSAIAAVVAIKTGEKADLPVPVIGGAVHLPTLGRLVIDPAESLAHSSEAILSVSAETVTVGCGGDYWTIPVNELVSGAPATLRALGDSRPADWQPVRKLRAPGLEEPVTLEDTDPYRDCHGRPAARLTAAEAARWQQQFEAAWGEITRDHPDYAPAIAAGLTVLMPMAPGPEGRDVSSTARDGFGAVGIALPADATTLALLIMHEFQHVKLGAILDLYDLFDRSDARLYNAPWRDDPRPLEGLFQGTYAHLAVYDYWRVRQQTTTGTEAQRAGEQFKLWHTHTTAAIETLDKSGSMTDLGTEFVAAMGQSAARWTPETHL